MARAPTTFDSFNAIAEPKHRLALDTLGDREMPVGELVAGLGWPQPQVSKHLAVLRQVGLVNVRRAGRRHFYTLNAGKLKPVHEWVRSFQRFWIDHLRRIRAVAEAKAKQQQRSQSPPHSKETDHG